MRKGSEHFTYDLAGNISGRTFPGAVTTTYTYDSDERLATAVTSSQTTSYAYDAAANLVTTTLPSGNGHVETRVFDRSDRLTQVCFQAGRCPLSSDTFIRWTYDAVGNRLTEAHSRGRRPRAGERLWGPSQVCALRIVLWKRRR